MLVIQISIFLAVEYYSGDLKSGLVWIMKDRKEVGLQMVRILMGSEIRKPNNFKFGQMAAILSKTICNPDKNVRLSNGWVIALAIAKARPFENRTI